jgi:dipeptidyl aminopeptidase/acylaminoacyl peptidase
MWAALVAGAGLTFLGVTQAEEATSRPAPGLSAERSAALESVVDRLLLRKGIASMKLSPDGTKVGLLAWSASGRTAYMRRGEAPYAYTLLVMDLATQKVTPIVAPDKDVNGAALQQASSFFWVSNDRLAVNLGAHCFVYTLDGQRERLLSRYAHRVALGAEGRDPFAIVGAKEIFEPNALHRINLRTGDEQKIPMGLAGIVVRTVWDGQGRLRAADTVQTAWSSRDAKVTSWYRHDEQSPWQKLLETGPLEDRWQIVATPNDSDKVIIASREGRDTWAIFGYDVASGTKTDLEVSHPTLDLLGVSVQDHEDLIMVRTIGLKPTTIWFDEAWQRVQAAVDAALPGAVNMLSGQPDGRVMIYTYSDRDPGRWLLLDTTRMKMRPLGGRLLNFDSNLTRPMETTSYPSLDGLTIPAYLTKPADGGGPKPMVVVIHGGPIARDHWGFNEEVQALAAAGYVVFQPQFRGSAGFGRKFETAGYRQWGLKMQDDITAGVQEMIRRGIADPERICIYGASYGGYASLWGLASTPELYRCGISFAGPSDIGEMFTDWSDVNLNSLGRDLMRFRIGDIDSMKADFDAVSPAKHANRIRVPVMLAHGEVDNRVLPGHTRRMARALEDARNAPEIHWYPHEGHGFIYMGDRRDFQLAMLSFLDRHIGPSSATAQKGARRIPAASPAPPS